MALETAEAIDLDSWSGCAAIFAIIPTLVINPREKTHGRTAITYYTVLIKLSHGFTDIK